MTHFLTVTERTIAEGVSPEELAEERRRLVAEFLLRPVQEFDTHEKTNGQKDVLGCETPDGRRVILRIGERRPEWFFPEGYVGEVLRIPKQFAAGGSRIPYELEEWIDGYLACEGEREWGCRGQLSPMMQDRLLAVFWEFQQLVAPLPLEQLFFVDRLRTYVKEAAGLIPETANQIIEEHQSFWETPHPSKWKFATDNLIIDPAGKIALIDNVRVGARYFGYDLGWLIWPRWIEMDVEYMDHETHITYLDGFMRKLVNSIPSGVSVPSDIGKAFHLMLFERLLGSLFDIHRQVRHLADWGMGGDAGARKREAHARFLQGLLGEVMRRI